MRRLSKPWPPGNVSPDGQAPRRFVDAEDAGPGPVTPAAVTTARMAPDHSLRRRLPGER